MAATALYVFPTIIVAALLSTCPTSADMDEGPRIISSGTSIEVYEGGFVTLPCEIEGDPRGFARKWIKDRMTLFYRNLSNVDDTRFELKNGNLEIENVQESDSGYYKCALGSGLEEGITHSLKVTKFCDPSSSCGEAGNACCGGHSKRVKHAGRGHNQSKAVSVLPLRVWMYPVAMV
ncbi:peroxidasin homolog [Macrosteles quadrilineatus]|uniref:peroxidasin homolog n=1 Tax=Macrosteles quadrilineatus TaxID=74068 RepID=UPI0023E22AB6|nr:peroxidasin homolog [Macrosteles quadrilineatus]